ncbi:MAG: hypothetical protein JNK92_10410 [Dechloromonas sp.]|nr:hypothetical protein [Dechloromonas sp.]
MTIRLDDHDDDHYDDDADDLTRAKDDGRAEALFLAMQAWERRTLGGYQKSRLAIL